MPLCYLPLQDNRDSLSKTIYSRLFDWLVDRINSSIGQDPHATSLIGVLDIYGGWVGGCGWVGGWVGGWVRGGAGRAGGRVCPSGDGGWCAA